MEIPELTMSGIVALVLAIVLPCVWYFLAGRSKNGREDKS